MTQLLVSVRNASEAEAALAGGAHVIDVKEPSRGSLGRANEKTIAEVVRVVAGRRPVSAALGEWGGFEQMPTCVADLQYVKWGLSKIPLEATAVWWEFAAQIQSARAVNPMCEVVAVAYVDAQQIEAPEIDEVYEHLLGTGQRVLLLDTFEKNGQTLLDWLDRTAIEQIVQRCHADGIQVALAGALGLDEMAALKYLQPDWFAVRGAVCQGQDRTAAIEPRRVRRLVELLTPATSGD
jgi:uncharacterized protein (UPF0264 family)